MDYAATMRSGYEHINAGDVAGFAKLVADDFVEHEATPGLPPTKEGTLEFFRVLLAAFPDMRMEVDDLFACGNKTVARVRARATHKGEFMSMPASGKTIDVELIDIMRFNDAGLVCEHWGLTDMLSLMQQIGALPPA
jgi:steroid delta-isomerase-like uncharacterized protein